MTTCALHTSTTLSIFSLLELRICHTLEAGTCSCSTGYDCIVNCEKIDTKDNCSDVMTKAVTVIIFKTLLPRLMGHSSLPVEVVVKMTNLASKYLRIKWSYKNDDFWNVDNHAKSI